MYMLVALGFFLGLLLSYLFLLNRKIGGTPDAVRKISPHRWTAAEIRETYGRLQDEPIDFASHLPPKLDRRYIVVGGSGLVGGHIILQLLARGQSPESIRLVDFRPPNRPDMLRGKASKVPFVQADITSEISTNDAFNAPWPKDVSNFPLTVFHTAAVINPSERAKSLLFRCSAVNTTGTAHVMAAAKAAGADIFVATASASIAIRPVKYWILPWKQWPERFFQAYGEDDAYQPLRGHYDYFGNYAVSKAHAEKLVLEANSPAFKTGCIRPANGVYGNKFDHTVGTYAKIGNVPTWIAHIVQNFVHAGNISIAHLHHERALLSPDPKAGGKTFVITDPNPPITFGDIYTLLSTIASTPFKVTYLSPILILLMAYPIEAYCLLRHHWLPFLPNLPSDVQMLQPGLFSISCVHLVATDQAAREPVEKGGLDYRGVCTTLEGMCMQIAEWNEEHEDEQGMVDKQIGREIGSLGTVPATIKA